MRRAVVIALALTETALGVRAGLFLRPAAAGRGARGVALRDGERMFAGAYPVGGPAQWMLQGSRAMLNLNQPTLDTARDLGPPLRAFPR